MLDLTKESSWKEIYYNPSTDHLQKRSLDDQISLIYSAPKRTHPSSEKPWIAKPWKVTIKNPNYIPLHVEHPRYFHYSFVTKNEAKEWCQKNLNS